MCQSSCRLGRNQYIGTYLYENLHHFDYKQNYDHRKMSISLVNVESLMALFVVNNEQVLEWFMRTYLCKYLTLCLLLSLLSFYVLISTFVAPDTL